MQWLHRTNYAIYAQARFQLLEGKADKGPLSRNDMGTMLYGAPADSLQSFRGMKQGMIQPQSRNTTNQPKTIKAGSRGRPRKQTKSMQAMEAMKA